MKNLNNIELKVYLESNFKNIYTGLERFDIPNEIDEECQTCQKDVYFKVNMKKHSNHTLYTYDDDLQDFYTLWVTCPRCKKNSFIQIIILKIERIFNSEDELMPIDFDLEKAPEEEDYHYKNENYVYIIQNIPTEEQKYSIKYIPEVYSTLRLTVSEAIFSMENKKNISAVIMFRRALQIIAKNILGAQGKTLYNQLTWLKTNNNLLNIDLSDIFHEYSTIIKNIGNQGAHPEEDEDLQNFTELDVKSLHDLFLIIVTEIFIKPEKIKMMKEELMQNRKLKQ